MRTIPIIAGALVIGQLIGATGSARASECGEQIRVLDDRYGLAVVRPDDGRAPGSTAAPEADQSSASGSSGASPTSSAGLDAVPNTGGVTNARNTPAKPLDAAQRARLRDLLVEARRAEQAGDGTTCAAKVTEARHLVQGDAGDRAK